MMKYRKSWLPSGDRKETVLDMETTSADIIRMRAEYARRAQKHDEAYKYSMFNPAALFAYQQRQVWILKILGEYGFYPLSSANILEVGCGSGGVLTEFLRYGVDPAKLHGIEVIGPSVQSARSNLPHLPLIFGDGQTMPFPDGSFQLVMQYTALSSVLDANVRKNIAREMVRVLDPEKGLILSYDFWINLVNRQTHGITPNEMRELFPNCTLKFHRITLAPPITRRLIKLSRMLCAVLENLTIFNSHHLVAITPNR